MKKILTSLGVMLLLLAGCNNGKNNNQTNGYSLKGTLKGIDSGMIKIVSNNEDDRTSKTLDSVAFKNGTFELKGNKEPQFVSVNIEPGNWSFQIFLEDRGEELNKKLEDVFK